MMPRMSNWSARAKFSAATEAHGAKRNRREYIGQFFHKQVLKNGTTYLASLSHTRKEQLR